MSRTKDIPLAIEDELPPLDNWVAPEEITLWTTCVGGELLAALQGEDPGEEDAGSALLSRLDR